MQLHASHDGSWSQTAKWAIALGKIPDQATSLQAAERDALVRAIARQISQTMLGQNAAGSSLPPALAATGCVAVASGRLYSCAIENRVHFKFYPRRPCAADDHDPDFTPPHKPSPRTASADEFVRLVVSRLRACVRSEQQQIQSIENFTARYSNMRLDTRITPEFKSENEVGARLIEGRMPSHNRNTDRVEFSIFVATGALSPMCADRRGNALIKVVLKNNITNPPLKNGMTNICHNQESVNDGPRLPELRYSLSRGLAPDLLLPFLVQSRTNQVLLEQSI